MVLNGCLAGLVGITAGADTVSPAAAVVIGLVAGVIVVLAVVGVDRLHIDDPVGAISVHGVVGIWGVMAVLLSNNEATFTGQAAGVGAIFAFVFGCSLIVWAVLKVAMGIRVSEEEEYEGVDISECGLEAYPEFTSAAIAGPGSGGGLKKAAPGTVGAAAHAS